MPNASSILCPLQDLLLVGAEWECSERQQYAFQSIKLELSSNRVLCHFHISAKLTLYVDASPLGLGAVLIQKDTNGTERTLAFVSITICQRKELYPYREGSHGYNIRC